MDRLNVGLIGAGLLGRAVHLPLLSSMADANVIAIADPMEANRAEASKIVPAATVLADHQSLLARADIAAVVIAVPTHLHASIATDAFAAGKHVYLEKPLCANADEADPLLAAWKASGKVGMVGLNYRFNPLFARLKQIIAAGQIGKPISVRTVFSTVAANMPDWKRSRKTGGGVLLDLATHHVDLLRFLFDTDITHVNASVQSIAAEADTATTRMSLANGIEASGFFSLASVQEHSVEVFGTAGKASASLYTDLEVRVERPNRSLADRLQSLLTPVQIIRTLPYILEKRRSPWNEPSFAIALKRFVGACAGGATPAPSFEDGRQAEWVIAIAERSAREGQPPPLPSP